MARSIAESVRNVFLARPATLGNISTRLPVGAGDRVLIAGFIVASMPIERQNYLALSLYRIKLPSENGEEKFCNFLGIAGQFLPVGGCDFNG